MVVVLLIAVAGSLYAQSGQGNSPREFGLGQPATDKGAGSYQHQVCAVGATPACSNMTTTVF
jgi:hypothetical protein